MPRKAGRIGFALLASPNRTAQERARKIAEDSRKYVQKQEGIELFCLDEPVMTLEDASRAASLFKRSEADAVVIQHGTASPDGLTIELTRDLKAPLAVWGIPEPPFDGGTITCGSMTGLLAHTAALTGIGRPFTFVYGLPDSEGARKQLDKFIRTAVVRRELRSAKIALIGYGEPGCLAGTFDPLAIKDIFGVEVAHVALSDVISQVNDLSDKEIEADLREFRSQEHLVEAVDSDALRRSCAAFAALKKMLLRDDFAAAAVKCRPELETQKLGMGVVCSRLTDAGIPASCEGDVDGALTMLIEQAYTARPTFLADWVQRDEKSNQVLFWHDGTAPASLANPKFQPKVADSPQGDGNAIFDFPLKVGGVTLARMLSRRGKYKLLVTRGRAVEPPQQVKGTHVAIRFEAPVQNLLGAMLTHGFPQHYSIVYENIKDEFIELARQLDIEVVSPQSGDA